jgi:hypothetical protein
MVCAEQQHLQRQDAPRERAQMLASFHVCLRCKVVPRVCPAPAQAPCLP